VTSPRFNLLPHRQILRQYAGQILLRQAIASVVAAVLCTVAGLGLIQMRVAMVDGFNQSLAAEMAGQAASYEEARRLRGQYQKMLERQRLIEALDARRSTSVLLLNDVAESMPQDVYLVRVEEDGVVFRLEGRATEAGAIARFLERLAGSSYLNDLVLGEVKNQEPESSAPYLFSLEGKVRLSHDVASASAHREPGR
jgi:Tfp pilus assembly protein PilN